MRGLSVSLPTDEPVAFTMVGAMMILVGLVASGVPALRASRADPTARGENADWVEASPSRFFLPAYIGARGWVGLRLDVKPVDWEQVAEFAVESYRLAAPRRLGAQAAGTLQYRRTEKTR